MLDSASKAFFHILAQNTTLKTLSGRFAMERRSSFVHRFVPGATVGAAIRAARVLEANGLTETFDHLGESVTTLDEAAAATRDYLGVIRAIMEAGVERNISLKLTQLGLDVDRASAIDNLRKILELAEPAGFFVRIDMESSRYTQVTLDIFETLWQQGSRQIGVVLQSDLRRSESDMQRINALGARIRLVKGAYREPKSVAYPKKADVDTAYVRMMKFLITDGHYPAIATHDPAMIDDRTSVGRRAQRRLESFRVSDVVRHSTRPAGDARRIGLPRAGVCAVWPRLVSVFHAPARRTPGECRLCNSRNLQRRWVRPCHVWEGPHRPTAARWAPVASLTLSARTVLVARPHTSNLLNGLARVRLSPARLLNSCEASDRRDASLVMRVGTLGCRVKSLEEQRPWSATFPVY